jgi:hypothetical protein
VKFKFRHKEATSNAVIRLKTIFFDSSKLFSLQSRNSPRKLSERLLSLQFAKNFYRKISNVAHNSIAYYWIWVLLLLNIIFLFSILPVSNLFPATAEEKSIFNGRVMDIEEKPVEGAEIFIYDSPDVKRPADFISARTDKEGRFQMVLPIGKYWAVARLRSGEKYGPLMPGDKHSGEPVEIELAPDKEIKKDFIVADIREAVRTKQKIRKDYIKIKGRILDKNGFPVKMVYAIADKNRVITEIPDYISAWTDNDGNYTLYLPRGKYYIGYATVFPPGQKYTLNKEVVFETDKSEVDIITNSE